MSSTRWRRQASLSFPVKRRSIRLRIRRSRGLVRLMSDGGTTRYRKVGRSRF
jgi:hypothetical protein